MLDELFEKIQVSMPADRPGQLSKQRNAEILAYVLNLSQFPAGKDPLTPEAGSLHGHFAAWP